MENKTADDNNIQPLTPPGSTPGHSNDGVTPDNFNIDAAENHQSVSGPPPPYAPPAAGYVGPYKPPEPFDPLTSGFNPPGTVQYHAGGAGPYGEQPAVIFITQQPQVIPVKYSFTMLYTVSCLAFWFCGFLFGAIAFLFAVFANNKSQQGKKTDADTMSVASLALSIIGFVTGCILWSLLIYFIVDE